MSANSITDIDLELAIARHPLTIAPTAWVVEAINLMSAGSTSCSFTCEINTELEVTLAHPHSSCVLVVLDHCLVGILTERDLVRLSATRPNLPEILIQEVMVSPVITLPIAEFTNLFVPLTIFQQHHIRHLPLVDEDGVVVGLLTHETLRQLLRPIDLLHLRLASEVMSTDVVRATLDTSIFAIAELMMLHQVSSVVIVEESETHQIPKGIITEQDIVHFLSLELDFTTIRAEKVMTSPVFSVPPDISLWSIRTLMQEHQINRVVVTDDQHRLLGIVTQTSLLNVLNPMEIYQMVETLEQKISRLESEKLELLKYQNSELERQVQERTSSLEVQVQRERLITEISTQIRSSLNLLEILSTAVDGVRAFLQCDRILVYQFESDGSGVVVAESVGENWVTSINNRIQDCCFQSAAKVVYSTGRTIAINNIHEAGYTECHIQLLEQYQVKANLVVPILVSGQMWGLLIGHHCAEYHTWDGNDLMLLNQISIQLAIAIQQATVYQEVQTELAERQKAEAALQEKRQFLSSIYDGIEQAVFTVDVLENGQFRFSAFNPACERLTGMLIAEMREKPPFPEIAKNFSTCIEAGVPICYEECISFQGKMTWWMTTLTPIQNAQAQIYRLVGTSIPITERKKMELALRESESRLAQLNQELEIKVEERTLQLRHLSDRLELALNAAEIGIWEWDIVNDRLIWDERMYDLYGIQPDDFQGNYQAWESRLHPDDLLTNRTAVQQAIAGEKDFKPEFRIILAGYNRQSD